MQDAAGVNLELTQKMCQFVLQNAALMETIKRGVYFLANDRILDITLAFLNSFRKYNPTTPLCLIPFRDDIEKLMTYSGPFRFEVFDDQEWLMYCDLVSLDFHPHVLGHYRKLAMWHGPFEDFIYVDVDMVVLKNLDFAFRMPMHAGFTVSFSDMPSIRQWVWKDSMYQTDLLGPAQINYAANTGFIISRRQAITRSMIEAARLRAAALQPHMELSCMEQPLLNYLMVTSGLACTSLYTLMDTPLYPENYTEYWAGNPARNLKRKPYRTWLKGAYRDVFLLHWAGTWQPKAWEIRLYGYLRRLGLRRTMWTTRIWMPYRRIWKKFRYLHERKGP